MSTFTQWNGPQGNSGPSMVDIVTLIQEYKNLYGLLKGHIDAVAPTDKAVHGIANYVEGIKTQLETLIGTKVSVTDFNALKKTVEDTATTTDSLDSTVSSLKTTVASKADSSSLKDKADTATVDTLSDKIDSIETTLNSLKDDFTKSTQHITDEGIMLAFDCAIKSAEFIIGKIKALKYIDFTQWHTVNAQYAGTGSSADSNTNGLYVLGKLSDDWSDDTNAPTGNKFKAARCFIKYENTHPLDAIIDMTATKTSEGWSGEIQAIVSKEANEWSNLQFHLCHGTYSDGKEAIYLCVSADGLAKNSANFSSLEFHLAGVNFIPLDIDTAKRVQVVSNNVVSTGVVPTQCKNSIVANTYNAATISTDFIQDTQGTSLFKVHKFIDELGQEHSYLMISDAAFDGTLLLQRPVLVTKNEEGDEVRSPFVTANDVQSMITLPAGFICQWPTYEDVTEEDEHVMYKATSVPTGFHATDGSTLSCEDYPELAKLLAENEADTEFTLPVADFSIIKLATDSYNDTPENRTEVFNYSQLTTTIKVLNDKLDTHLTQSAEIIDAAQELKDTTKTLQGNIDAEEARAKGAEQTLQGNIDAEEGRATGAEQDLQDNIDKEEARATGAEQTLATYLIDKPVYPSADDLPNITPDAQGNVTNDGDIVIVFDGNTIVQYKATVTGTAVTWTEV